jgi:hypothetical protein
LKSFSICAALILAAAAFSTSAEAQHRGFGGGARMGGAHFSGARVGSFGGARIGNIAGPGRMSAYGGRAIYSGGRYAYGYGRGHGYRGYGGYWPWWGVDAGLAVAAAWPYYGGYGYSDDCVQWRPDYGWVNPQRSARTSPRQSSRRARPRFTESGSYPSGSFRRISLATSCSLPPRVR